MATRPLARRGEMARALDEIADAARERAEEIAELIVQEIRLSPDTPRPGANNKYATGDLLNSYSVMTDPATGDVVIVTSARHWAFVEYGTAQHGDAQPHVAPAIETVRAALT